MNILLLNQDWFAKEFREAGHHVVTIGNGAHLDFQLDVPLVHIDRLIAAHLNGARPDVIVVHDNSAPVMVQGLDETHIPTLFYSVDTHHHAELHKYFCFLFDEVLVAQKDYLPAFETLGFSPRWLPLWASRTFEPSTDKDFDAVFVGTLNPKLNPDRVRFLNALKEKAPIHFQAGNFWEIFPKSEIVLNQTVKGDLNFRVFEAMMSGSALLTERTPNGLLELFEDNVHLTTYTKNNVDEAAERIHELLGNRSRARELGRYGREEVFKKHLPIHRAEVVLEILKKLEKKRSSMRFFAAMANFTSLAVKMERFDTSVAGRALIAALKAAEYALQHDERINEEIACFAVIACLRYEAVLRTGTASKFLAALGEKFPDLEVLTFANIRTSLNNGDRAHAQRLAERVGQWPLETTYHRSELFVRELLAATVVDESAKQAH